MKLHTVDFLMILLFLAVIVSIGLIARKQAQRSKGDYLLGGNTIPWYMLGLSNASGMFDISGTMWLVAITFVYGLKSIWIPWLWPVFNQVFLMVFLSQWLRRSNVTTGAEWIKTRFGTGEGARLSNFIVIVFALISCLGFLAYGFVGLGKFLMLFIPWEFVAQYIPFHISEAYVPHFYGIIFTVFATFYAILGGMKSIVWADVFQYLIMTISAIVIAIIAMRALSSETLNVPEGWHSPFFGWKLNLDWSQIIANVNAKIESDGYSLFSVFFMMMLFKGVLVSAAGPAPNYDMQKILSTKSPAEAAKMSGFVSVALLPVRYFMIIGFVVLALLYYDRLNLMVGDRIDFEQILPAAMIEFVPAGLLGLMLVGLLAAFMSTFAGTLNAAQAYLVNDIYLKKYPNTPKNKLTRVNYITGITVVIVSTILGLYIPDVNRILQWIVSGLWGGYIASNVLKWYWWRFNGHGYFWGMVGGLVPAMIFPLIFKNTLDLYYFPLLLLLSVTGCVLGTYLTPATDKHVLMNFYKQTRPWGFWEPIIRNVRLENAFFKPNKSFKLDMLNVVLGTIGQTAIVALPIYLVLKNYLGMGISAAIVIVVGIIMKKLWWDKLD
ncbi:sodium:solute symporter family protein [uncultured Draconibacterium sp.]|uniref:sodium:solute symporter family protein n=1 Tax=uncultured Draconibacterium sp. TaxID=1573823 RepID=UPI0029C67670|nr:sodium:solute symporter family protein [uncultured Draconibacterium sp.]